MSEDAPLLVAVDVGTTGARAAAVDLSGRVVAVVRRAYRTHSPQPGWAEQDAREWAGNAVSALSGLVGRLGRRGRVAAIGLTGQCPTVVAVDANANPVGPGMLYRDNRAVLEAREMRERLGEEAMHRRTGHVAQAFHVGPKVLWLRRNRPDIHAQARVFLQPRDVVLHRLTGRLATDETNANATLLFDIRERRWASDLFDAFDIDPARFPEVLPSWETAGELSAPVAAEVGLTGGIPVVIGAADSQCAAFGAGVVEPGPVSEMAGSSSCFNSAVDEPLGDVRVTHYSHVVPGRFCTELGINTSGAAIDWAVRRLGYPTHAAFAADAQRGARRLRRFRGDPREAAPLFLPYLGDGERDDPALRAGILGLSLRHDRPALAYAVLEGLAFGVHGAVADLEAAGAPVTELRVSGGGARLGPLSQLKADVLGRPVIALKADAAAIGAALLAAPAAGLEAESADAVAGVIATARRFEPEGRGDRLAERLAWFRRRRSRGGEQAG